MRRGDRWKWDEKREENLVEAQGKMTWFQRIAKKSDAGSYVPRIEFGTVLRCSQVIC